ncbi:MAG: AAA family ATPase [Cyanobacteria bacterium P01_F01_bin.56]
MKITKLHIKNLRGLSDIELDFDKPTNVIVGPNAVGKTTILEAIRLTKALLMPRYFQESQQVLISLGAMSNHPHLSQFLDFSSLARDVTLTIQVKMTIELSTEEHNYLFSAKEQLALEVLKGQLGNSENEGQLALTQYMSSDKGKRQLSDTLNRVKDHLNEASNPSKIFVELSINPNIKTIQGSSHINQAMLAMLEKRLPPHQALFSYFPADRAFPTGEVNIQIGASEANNQIQSHIGQAATKYQRLKQSIVNNLLLSGIQDNEIRSDFRLLFKELLQGKDMKSLSVSSVGMLTVLIEELSSGQVFDIDGMSSGEKGLILTFMLLKRTLASGGIALLDEPELHLNPAVCKKIIPFISNDIIEQNDIQVILCTHSGEILGSAFDRDDCTVYHLRSHNDATKIYEQDNQEVFTALNRLGTSAVDSIFSRGNIFVEGDHDTQILEDGFNDLVTGYRITALGGRSEVEKEIKTLQKAESEGRLDRLHCFIFDYDRMPTEIQNSQMVKVLQWDRYCLENYLIGSKILFDELKDLGVNGLESRGSFTKKLKKLALQQLTELTAKNVYGELSPTSPGLRAKEIEGKSFTEMSDILLERLIKISSELQDINIDSWKDDFVEKCNGELSENSSSWGEDWIKYASGKRLIDDLYKEYSMNIPKLLFKRKLVKRMMIEKTEDWTLVRSKIQDALAV